MQKLPENQLLNNAKTLLLPAVFLFVFLALVLPQTGHPYDNHCWARWAEGLFNNGLQWGYDKNSSINYLPLYVYVLKLYSWFAGSANACFSNIYYLKLFTLVFDVLSIIVMCSFIQNESKRLQWFLFGVLNIGFLYNTIVWGQVDGIFSFFVLVSFVAAFYKKTLFSTILFLIALNFKLQAIVFLPFLGIFWLQQVTIKKASLIVFSIMLAQFIIIAPFVFYGNAKNIVKVAFGSVDYFQVVSMNAFNIWHLLLNGDLMKTPDNITFMGISYKNIGLLMFATVSFVLLFPYLKNLLLNFKQKTTQPFTLNFHILTLILIGYSFFFFNTQMHERYVHPSIVLISFYAILNQKWGLWLLLTVNYALTLEGLVQFLKLNNYNTLVFDPKFSAAVFLIGFLWCFSLWVSEYKKAISNN